MHNAKYLGHISKNQLPSATGLDSQKGSPRDLKKGDCKFGQPPAPSSYIWFYTAKEGKEDIRKEQGLQAVASSSSIINAMVCT